MMATAIMTRRRSRGLLVQQTSNVCCRARVERGLPLLAKRSNMLFSIYSLSFFSFSYGRQSALRTKFVLNSLRQKNTIDFTVIAQRKNFASIVLINHLSSSRHYVRPPV